MVSNSPNHWACSSTMSLLLQSREPRSRPCHQRKQILPWPASQPASQLATTILFLTENHRDESEIVSVHAGGAEDIEEAVKAARAAFPAWRDVPATKRGALLLKLADLVEQHEEVLATIETWNNGVCLKTRMKWSAELTANTGMPISRKADIGELTAVSRYYAGYADKSFGQG